MKKILIIEDEWISAKRLEKQLRNLDDTIQIDGPLKSVDEVIACLKDHNDYDLIFSDIRLTDGDIFHAFREVQPNCFVIFTTSYDEYAMQAIKSNGLDYLLKPFDEEELQAAINKAKRLTAQTAQAQDFRAHKGNYRERFLAYRQDELVPIATKDVLYFYKDDRKVSLRTTDGKSYSLSLTMQELEEQLCPHTFFRINRQYIVNIKGIKKISLYFNSKLLVQLHHCDDQEVIVSKERTAMFKEWLDK
jgi:DNA-binding LytR/AlgR family response regulator